MEKETKPKTSNYLAEIQAKLNVPKDLFNSFGDYHYRSAETILNALKPLINTDGYSITLTDEIVNIGNRIYVKAIATLTNGKDTYTSTAFARESEIKKGMDESQITGAASSYARKYALNGLFAIDDTKDADAANTHGKEESKPNPLAEIPLGNIATKKVEIKQPVKVVVKQVIKTSEIPNETFNNKDNQDLPF